ncbi:MAG: hypothetical protein CO149_05665, partial [Nitrospirae bacterium CG_4_9_14_3_um_filter_51_5]
MDRALPQLLGLGQKRKSTRISLLPSVNLFLLLGLLISGTPLLKSSVLAQPAQSHIEAIEIEGNQHIEGQAIVGKLSVKPGDSFTQESIREQIQLIYGMGFFEEVEVSTEARGNGVLVVFHVKEKPFTVEVVFDGNDELSDDKLNEKNTIKNQV